MWKRLRRSGKNTQNNYLKKDFNDLNKMVWSHDGVITHTEPEILECKAKCALGSITMNESRGGDRILVEVFKNLKDDAVQVLPSICQQIWKTQRCWQNWKKSVFIPIPERQAKECSNYHTTVLILHASKVMLKILQAKLKQYVNWKLPGVPAMIRKGRGTRDQIANICWAI